MILLMVPLVPLRGGVGARLSGRKKTAGNFSWLLQSTPAWPQMNGFVLLSPRGGRGGLAPNVKSPSCQLPRSSLWLGCAKGLWELELDMPRGMQWQGCSGEHHERRATGRAHDPANSQKHHGVLRQEKLI